MPSLLHDTLVDLFRERPELAPMLLRWLGFDVPDGTSAVVAESTFPLEIRNYLTDLVIDLPEPDGPPRRAVVVLEVQLAVDEDKPYRWLLYQAAAQDRHRCATLVVVLTMERRVAAWARRPVPCGPHRTYAPVVLGPEEIPKHPPPEELARVPELAVLIALVHGFEPEGEPMLAAATEALHRLESERAGKYLDLLLLRFGEVMERVMEAIMGTSDEPQSEYFRKRYRAAEAKGLAEGEAKGFAEALLAILRARGIDVTQEARGIIEECQDPVRLRAWVERAATAKSLSEVIAPG